MTGILVIPFALQRHWPVLVKPAKAEEWVHPEEAEDTWHLNSMCDPRLGAKLWNLNMDCILDRSIVSVSHPSQELHKCVVTVYSCTRVAVARTANRVASYNGSAFCHGSGGWSLQARSWEGHVSPEISERVFPLYSYLLLLFKVTDLFILATPACGLSCSSACGGHVPALQGGFLASWTIREPLLLPPFWQLLGILVFLGLQQHYASAVTWPFPHVSLPSHSRCQDTGHWVTGPTLVWS